MNHTLKKLLCAVLLISLPVLPALAQKKKDAAPKKGDAAASSTKTATQAIDFKVRPTLGEPREFSFPDYKEAMLPNGLKLIVIEDHKQPTVGFRLQVRAGENLDEPGKSGTSFMMSNLMGKGTAKRSAEDIANQTDSVGISVSANTVGELVVLNADGLKKHMGLMMSIFADVIINPTFPQEEMDKLMPQVMASIKQEKGNPMQLAQALSRMVLYGKDNPSARRRTEASVKSITQKDIVEFHKKYFRPNNMATLAIVGDVTMAEMLPKIKTALARWEANDKLTVAPPPAPKPMPQGVYFIQRPGSVQSTVIMTALLPPRKDPRSEPLSLATSLLGSGFGGRLFKTLRETYSYTYTPFAFQTQGKYMNRFIAGADVRSSVTDSALTVLKAEIGKVTSDAATDSEFDLIKQSNVADYMMSFEKGDFIASILQNADYMEQNIEFVKGYAKRLSAYTPFDAQRAAATLYRPDQCFYVVVGSPDVAPLLEKFGRVFTYNLDLEPQADSYEKVAMSVDELLKKHAKAIGSIDAVTSIVQKGSVTIEAGGQKFTGTGMKQRKAPNKQHTVVELPVMRQEIWIDGVNAATMQNKGAAEPMSGDDATLAIDDATLFGSAKLVQLGYTCEILGKRGGEIIMKAKKLGKEQELYFNEKTMLLSRVDKTQNTPQGPIVITQRFSNYENTGGVMLPKTERQESPFFTVITESTYEVNTPVNDTEFTAPK
ncbi:MAG: insulinase family protein [Candidatus Kapabacteria bacterium]|nr:insulinase family protein [Candidatus Kapabacteria bacterium]